MGGNEGIYFSIYDIVARCQLLCKDSVCFIVLHSSIDKHISRSMFSFLLFDEEEGRATGSFFILVFLLFMMLFFNWMRINMAFLII